MLSLLLCLALSALLDVKLRQNRGEDDSIELLQVLLCVFFVLDEGSALFLEVTDPREQGRYSTLEDIVQLLVSRVKLGLFGFQLFLQVFVLHLERFPLVFKLY